ncbi:MAG: hypothetical protein ABSH51_23675 [Solirubrobacteraceae bacterium]
MSATSTIFHTATVDNSVPGPPADMAALAYNLQYTAPQVDELVATNPPERTDFQVVRLQDRELVRANLYGRHPDHPSRRLCAIGIGDGEDHADAAARVAWHDFHASVLFTELLADHDTYKLSLKFRVPGVPAQRATTVGVDYDLHYMRPLVEAAVSRNMPTNDEVHVVQAGELMLMRVDLYGRHPLDSSRTVCVGGVADRHYRAMAAAEAAWRQYHNSLMFAARALGST